jgi:hypothetical protein
MVAAGEPVLRIFDLETSKGYIFNRTVDDKILTFELVDKNSFRDEQTGSLWEISSGKAIEGPLIGKRLNPAYRSINDFFTYLGISPHSIPQISIWQRFDANWYLSIAQRGYGIFPDDTHFGPLYPLLVRIFYFIVKDWLIAALLVAQLAVIWAIKLLYEAFVEWGDHQLAQKGIAIFLIFPSTFFLFSAYAEPLFIATSLAALQNMRNKNWLMAGFWSACAILTRVQGVALLLPLAWVIWKEFRWKIQLNHIKAFLFPGIASLAYIGLRIAAGAPSAIPMNEPSVAARMVFPWQNFITAFDMLFNGTVNYINVINLFITLLFFALLIAGWKKVPLEYSLYGVACLLILISREVETMPLNPMIRYALTIPSAFYMLAIYSQNRWFDRVLIITSFALGLFLSAQFFLWSYVA